MNRQRDIFSISHFFYLFKIYYFIFPGSSLAIAKEKIKKANKLFELEMMEDAVSNAYSAMFHSSRAILFKDGFKERSHYAILVYIKEAYSNKIEMKFINELNILRLERHEINYGLEKKDYAKNEVERTIKLVSEFLIVAEKLIV
ncbi:HEPN domain-containing protein [Candidatus Woesearchaeota archaeon]|nr:HEPN domain-containing protein [Candidatus Woesearchaeota archaeon]